MPLGASCTDTARDRARQAGRRPTRSAQGTCGWRCVASNTCPDCQGLLRTFER